MSDAQGYKVDGYTTVDLLGSYQLPVGTLSFSIENLFDRDYTTVWGQRAPLYYSPGYGPASLYDYRQGPNLWSELLCAVLTGIPLQQRYADINMAADSQVDII
ncbi:Ferric aerobactin receptor [Escherichia coli]|nr:Ferric aerobactin receptor [Escherichia coli]